MALTEDTERQKISEITEKLSQGMKELAEMQGSIADGNNPEEWEKLRNALAEIRESSSVLLDTMDGKQPVAEQEQDFSAMKRAEQYITELEAEKTIFVDGERDLIVNYAYKMDSFEDAKDLADLLAFQLENSPNLVPQTVHSTMAEIDALPDAMIGLSEMHDYGYSWEEMLPLTKERAAELFNRDIEVYQLHVDGAETLIEDIEDIENHGGIFGIEKGQWGLYQEREAHAQNYFEERNMEPVDQLLLGEQNQYGIFQLKRNDETRDIRFMSHDFLEKNGIAIDRENYDLVYIAPLTEDITLEGLYETFNIDRPEDFTGHSLSMSDVIVLHQNGENISHYVDTFGFTKIPEFHRYPTIEEQIAEEETVDLLAVNTENQVEKSNSEEGLTEKESSVSLLQQEEKQHSISYYVIGDLATWANNSKERSALERFDNSDDAISQFRHYKGKIQEYNDDSARTTLGVSVEGKEFDLLHVRNGENYLVQDFTHILENLENDKFFDSLQILYSTVGFDKTRLHGEMTPEEVKDFVKTRFEHQLKSGGLEDISLYMDRFDAVYEQGKMEHLMPTANQRRVQEDIPFTEWKNPYFMPNEVDELAVAVEDKFIGIHKVEDGYDYTIYHADYREYDGGVYDNTDISIHTALDEIVADLKLTEPQITPISYDELAEKVEKVEQQDISAKISKQVEDNRIVDDFKAKTREHFHNINGETPDDIENTVHAYVKSKIEEYDARASIVGMAVVGSRCRGLEQEKSDLDVVVEFAGNEREDDLFNLLHENGLMIGGVMVDINPITEAKTGTLATYLPIVEQYLTEKQAKQEQQRERAKEQIEQGKTEQEVEYDTVAKVSLGQSSNQVTVTLTVAECTEFHNVGEYHKGIKSVQDAITIWEQIPPERLHGIPGIGINVHTEGTSDYEDTQWDILFGKVIDLDNLSYVPDITNNLPAIRFIAELMEKIPDVEVYGSLKPWLQSHTEKIAMEIDQLANDYDPYEYKDQVEDREAHIQSIASDIRNGEAEYMEDFLNALIAEGTTTGIQDIFGQGVNTNDSEAIQNARKAKELLDRLTEYKPLTKVEELVEQNYNMIDNALNNGAGGEKQMQKSERVSVKERLEQKKAEIEQRHFEKTVQEKENSSAKRER